MGISWKRCAQLPTKLNRGNSVVINGKVYFKGDTEHADVFKAYCYDPSQNNWTTLPPLPVRWFSLGQVNGKLVAIGGKRESDNSSTNEVLTYDERARKWKRTTPPMITARDSSGVISLQSALVVAGGDDDKSKTCTDVVEVFKPGTSQWYKTDPLPTPCFDVSLTTTGGTCYVIGGFGPEDMYLNQALTASVDDLLHNAVPAKDATSVETRQSAWKKIANTPTYHPTAALLDGKLLAMGGREMSKGGEHMKGVYVYSPSIDSWMYMSDLPAPCSEFAVATLSSTEILVIGGVGSSGRRVNDVYKGTMEINIKV